MRLFDQKNIELMHELKGTVESFNKQILDIITLINQQQEIKNEYKK